jgi:hypothetical protein
MDCRSIINYRRIAHLALQPRLGLLPQRRRAAHLDFIDRFNNAQEITVYGGFIKSS